MSWTCFRVWNMTLFHLLFWLHYFSFLIPNLPFFCHFLHFHYPLLFVFFLLFLFFLFLFFLFLFFLFLLLSFASTIPTFLALVSTAFYIPWDTSLFLLLLFSNQSQSYSKQAIVSLKLYSTFVFWLHQSLSFSYTSDNRYSPPLYVQ